MYRPRTITHHLKSILGQFPILSLTGPRQSGKTTLLRNEFPDYRYFNLERMDQREMVLTDPVGFLNATGPKVIFDEAQHTPSLFSYIQAVSDERNTPGQYILSGSQSFLMNERISQSLAGRVHISHLFPFDIVELQESAVDVNKAICNGFYPRLLDTGISPTDFYPSYIQTYIERDVRTLKAIENLNAFTRFLGLCAGRIGQVLNLTSLANDAGIAVNTAKAWLSLLESSFIIFQLQPFYNNFSKRLIKSPKIYFYDTGVACSLLKINHPEMIRTHYLYGALFENLVIAEIAKYQHHQGKHPSLYYWRESNGTEIDCIIEKGNNELLAIEIKAGETFNTDYIKSLLKFPTGQYNIEKKLIYSGDHSTQLSGIQLIGWNDFQDFLKQV
jgi:uncharacterized protein